MRKALFLVTILVFLTALASGAFAAAYLVNVETSPSTIPADGKSYSQIMVTVTQPDGTLAPDGLDVHFTTTAGTITPYSRLGAGRASAILTSSASAQLAMITVTVSGITGSAQVEFAAGNEAISTLPKTVRMSGGSLAYAIERDTVLGKDDVIVEYRGLTVKAMNAQVCEILGVIRAQGNVKITQAGESVEADAFTCDLRTDRCRILQDGENPVTSTFDVDTLDQRQVLPTPAGAADFAPLEANGAKTWIISRRLTIFPRERIQFVRVSLYLGDAKVVRMPYYCYSYQSRESIIQQVKYTSKDGIVVDMPVYYHMADSGMGAFKLKYTGSGPDYGGYFQARQGFALGLEQAYSGSDKMEGRISVDSIADSNRSFQFAHHTEFGNLDHFGRIDLTAQYQPQSSFAKEIYNTCLNLNGGLGKYDYSVSGYMGGSKFRTYDFTNLDNVGYTDQSDGSVRATLRTRRSLLPNAPVSLMPTFTLGYGRPGYTPGIISNPGLYQTLGLGLGYTPRSKSLSGLSFDGQTAFTSTADGLTGIGMRTAANLRRSWRGGSASLSYVLNLQSGSVASLYSPSKRQVNGTLFLGSGSKWNCIANCGYGLDTGQLNLYSSATYRIARKWTFRTNYSLYRYKYTSGSNSIATSISYLKAGIYRPIGPYEIGIAYSPTGQDYGLKPTKRLWLDVGLSGF